MEIPDIKSLNCNTIRSVYISKHYPEFYSFLMDNYKDCKSLSEKLYLYYNRLEKRPRCVVCGSDVKFINFTKGFRETCSCKCSKINPNTNLKRKQTNLVRYGVENPMKNQDIKNKLKNTNIERYGVENPFSSEIVKEKIKQTNLERYGGTSSMCSVKTREKAKKTNLMKYGVEYISQAEVIKRKKEQTFLIHYGVENPQQDKDVREKTKLTNNERYGYFCNFSNHIIKEKIKQTNLERYGVENPLQNEYIKEKVTNKLKENSIESHSDLLRYTEEGNWICKCPHPECSKCPEKEYVIPTQRYYDRKRLGTELCTKLLPIQSFYSTYELQIRNFLDSLNIEYITNDRSIIPPKELDIYIPSKKIAIEFNGSYWHSSKDKYYHQNKTKACYSKGILLIHIYEYEWNANKEIILERLKEILNGKEVDGIVSVKDYDKYTLSEPILIDCGSYKIWNEGEWQLKKEP